jgi:hypothetical protein
MTTDTVDLDCIVLYETEQAWKCRFDDKGFPVWVPKAHATMEQIGSFDKTHTCTMPVWLATNENLI